MEQKHGHDHASEEAAAVKRDGLLTKSGYKVLHRNSCGSNRTTTTTN